MQPIWHDITRIFEQSDRIFHWTGLSGLGECHSGKIVAKSRKEAQQLLRTQTIIIKKITSQYSWPHILRSTDITQMLQQLSRLLHTGIGLSQALQVLRTCQSHPKIVTLVHQIQWELASGSSLAEVLNHYPRWFDPFVCALVHLGERTGELNAILEKICQQQNKNHALRQHLKTLIMYPMIVLLMASITTIYLLVTVVPQLQTFFLHAKQALPWSTALLLSCSAWLQHYGMLGLGLWLSLCGYFKIAYQQGRTVQKWWDKWLLQLPMVGSLYQALHLSRAFYALSITQQSSLPLPDALQWIASITSNFYYKQAFLQIRHSVEQGESLRSAILQTQLFPELVVQLLSLGEESGSLGFLLEDLAQYYNQTAEDTIQRLSRCIEPMLMIILGLILGGLILSIYLPMIQLGALL